MNGISSRHYRKPHVYYCQLVNSAPGMGRRHPQKPHILDVVSIGNLGASGKSWWKSLFDRIFRR